METWWTSMTLIQQIVWCIAIAASLVFVIQMIMTFAGMSSDTDFSADAGDFSDGEHSDMPFQLFTFRNFINFFLGFSWSYIVFYGKISNQFLLVFVSAAIGVFIVAGVMFIFYGLSKMTQEGNIYIEQAVGLTATVYLPVPAHEQGMGKIQVSVQKSVREYDAVTLGEALPTGHIVKIIAAKGHDVLLVEKI
jgi:hypothetical protein